MSFTLAVSTSSELASDGELPETYITFSSLALVDLEALALDGDNFVVTNRPPVGHLP